MPTKRPEAIAAICALVSFIVFAPILKGSFVWDDNDVQINQVPAFKSLKDAFVVPPLNSSLPSKYYYRPLVNLSYMADEALNGYFFPVNNNNNRAAKERAAIPHASTLLFHLAAVFSFTLLAAELLKGKTNASIGVWAAGLVFALHPAHSETVCTIAGRSDSLAAAFLMAFLLFALKGRSSRLLKYRVLAGLCFFMSLLAKELALMGLVLLPAMYLAFKPGDDGVENKSAGPDLPLYGILALALLAYLALRALSGTVPLNSTQMGFADRIVLCSRALAYFIWHTVAPWPFAPVVHEPPGMAVTLAVFLSCALFLFAELKFRRRSAGMTLFSAAWFLATIAPAVYIAGWGVSSTAVAERYLYMPSAALAIYLGFSAAEASARPILARILTPISAAVLIAFGISSWRATAVWADERSLWEYALTSEDAANHGLSWLNMGNTYFRAGENDKAAQAYEKVLSLGERSPREIKASASCNLGVVEVKKGVAEYGKQNYFKALEHFRNGGARLAVAVNSGVMNFLYFSQMANAQVLQVKALMALGKGKDQRLLENAEKNASTALSLMPGNPSLINLVAQVRALRTE